MKYARLKATFYHSIDIFIEHSGVESILANDNGNTEVKYSPSFPQKLLNYLVFVKMCCKMLEVEPKELRKSIFPENHFH